MPEWTDREEGIARGAGRRVRPQLPPDPAFDVDDAVQAARVHVWQGKTARHGVVDGFRELRGKKFRPLPDTPGEFYDAASSESPAGDVERRDLCEVWERRLRWAMQFLTRSERRLFVALFYRKEEQKTAGRRRNVTGSAIGHRKRHIVAKLRDVLTRGGLWSKAIEDGFSDSPRDSTGRRR